MGSGGGDRFPWGFGGGLLGGAIVAALVLLFGLEVATVPAPVPAPADPLAAAITNYHATWPKALHGLAAGIRSGAIGDKAAAVKALGDHAKPLADRLDGIFAGAIDREGKIERPGPLADGLDHAAHDLSK